MRGNPGGVRGTRPLVRRAAVRRGAQEGAARLRPRGHLRDPAKACLRRPEAFGPPGGLRGDGAGAPEKRRLRQGGEAHQGRSGLRQGAGGGTLRAQGFPHRPRGVPGTRAGAGGKTGERGPSGTGFRLDPHHPVQEIDALGRPRRAVRAPRPLDRIPLRGPGDPLLVRERDHGEDDIRPPIPVAGAHHPRIPRGILRPAGGGRRVRGPRGPEGEDPGRDP